MLPVFSVDSSFAIRVFAGPTVWLPIAQTLQSTVTQRVTVSNVEEISRSGLEALLKRGAVPWPNPQSGTELELALDAAASLVADVPTDSTLPLALWEPPAAYASPPATPDIMMPSTADKPSLPAAGTPTSPELELLNAVKVILRRELANPCTEDEVASLLAITKPQAKQWLALLMKDGLLEKVTSPKPVRYRTIQHA